MKLVLAEESQPVDPILERICAIKESSSMVLIEKSGIKRVASFPVSSPGFFSHVVIFFLPNVKKNNNWEWRLRITILKFTSTNSIPSTRATYEPSSQDYWYQ